MLKRIIWAIILSVISLLIFIGFKSNLLPLRYLIIIAILLLFAHTLRNKLSLFSKIIFILIGSLIPAYAIGILVLLATIFILHPPWSYSAACDMGGAGIAAIIFGMFTAVISYLLIVIIGFIYFRKKKFTPFRDQEVKL